MNEILETAMPVAYAAVMVLAFAAILGAIYYALKGGMISEETLKTGLTVLEGVQQSAQALAGATGNGACSVVTVYASEIVPKAEAYLGEQHARPAASPIQVGRVVVAVVRRRVVVRQFLFFCSLCFHTCWVLSPIGS